MNRSDSIDSLRIYHIMIAPYRNGNPRNGFGSGYGPSHHMGDLPGVLQALDVIAGLGFNALLLSPIFATAGDAKRDSTGYFPTNFFAVDPRFGTEDDLRALLAAAHDRGMAVLLDCPFGHKFDRCLEPTPDERRLLPSKATVMDPFGLGYEGADFSAPDTVDFANAVATYWIDQFGIDGWRADQAYQVSTNGRNVWDALVAAVRKSCLARASRGERWGVLGCIIGEVWRAEHEIAKFGYGAEGFLGLDSCFDFPLRYRLLQVLATEEDLEGPGGRKNYGHGAETLRYGLDTRSSYPSHAHPSLMIGSHDLPRLGNLILRCPLLGYGRQRSDYWRRHELAIAFLAATSGPIVVFYGEEIGDMLDGYVRSGDLGWTDRNAARMPGRFAGTDPRYAEQEVSLSNYTRRMMALRAGHAALWKGRRRNLIARGAVFVEEKVTDSERLWFAMNLSPDPAEFEVEEAAKLVDLLTGESLTGANHRTRIPMGPLSARFLSVIEGAP